MGFRQVVSTVVRVAVVLSAGAGAGACGSGFSQVRQAQMTALAEDPGAVVQVRRPGCIIGNCPVYGVSVAMDGTVIYEGRANVATVGVKRGKISPEGLNEILTALHEVRFLDSAEACCVCPEQEAARPVLIDYRPGTVQKTVFHDRGCASAPPEMSKLEETIEKWAGVAQWTEKAAVHAAPPAAPAATAKPRPAVAGASAVVEAPAVIETAPMIEARPDGEVAAPQVEAVVPGVAPAPLPAPAELPAATSDGPGVVGGAGIDATAAGTAGAR